MEKGCAIFSLTLFVDVQIKGWFVVLNISSRGGFSERSRIVCLLRGFVQATRCFNWSVPGVCARLTEQPPAPLFATSKSFLCQCLSEAKENRRTWFGVAGNLVVTMASVKFELETLEMVNKRHLWSWSEISATLSSSTSANDRTSVADAENKIIFSRPRLNA